MPLIRTILPILLIALPLQVLAANDTGKITVTGTSERTVEADSAIIEILARNVDKEMNQSHSSLTKTILKLAKELKSLGLNDNDIRKSLIRQGTEYGWVNNSRVFQGYYSECIVYLDIRDIQTIGNIYRHLASYPDITIQRTDYKRTDEFGLRKKEFEKALLQARKKAEYMAQALNVKIGKIHSIQEIESDNFPVFRGDAMMARRESGEILTGFGSIKIMAAVRVEIELE